MENKHTEKFRKKLRPGETIIDTLAGPKWQKIGNGVLVLTNERLCFYKGGVLGEIFETMPVDKISSVEFKSMMGIRKFTFHTTNDKLEFQPVDNKEKIAGFSEQLEQMRHRSEDPVARQTPQDPDPVAQIKALSELHQQGVLTDEEFASKKAELLSRL